MAPIIDSWVRKFIAWWIDEKSGYQIPSCSGKTRWFFIQNDQTILGSNREELIEKDPNSLPNSVFFVASTVHDNKTLQVPCNKDFLRELENFPEGAHDDIVDALSGAFLMLSENAYYLAVLMSFSATSRL